jgi:hypothetical protein
MRILLLSFILIFGNAVAHAQTGAAKSDSVAKATNIVKPYNPRVATRRSLILPGWGQYTNKKYWKIPLAGAAVGIPAYLFVRNIKQYREVKAAIANFTDGNPANDTDIPNPYYSVRNNLPVLNSFKASVRQNADYSVLFFIIMWGLNVADAAVDANLKTFNVDDDIGLHLKLGNSELAQTNGVSLVFGFGKKRK